MFSEIKLKLHETVAVLVFLFGDEVWTMDQMW